MKFWKLHGIGNDFIIIDGRYNNNPDEYYSEIAKKVCHRKYSVGADGLLIIKYSQKSDIKMVYYNADGSRAAMCGNGIRCFAKYIYCNSIISKNEFSIETLDGDKQVKLTIDNNEVKSVRVNMGTGSLLTNEIPANLNKEMFIEENINVLDKSYKVSAMLMGVPHAVIFVDELDNDEVLKYGRLIEKNKIFPKGINVNFVQILDYDTIEVRTWERGCGYTLGCGTGMTAAAIISNKLGHTSKIVNVNSEGGTVTISIEESIYMTGPAVKICEGILEVK